VINIVEIPEIKVELQGVFGDDRWIAEAAWTSSLKQENKALRTDEDVTRFINLLANEKHSVPFESVVFRFWIRMPISTDRQFMTHRLQSASGLSGRYRTMPSEWQDAPSDVKEITQKVFGDGEEYGSGYMSIVAEYNDQCQNAFTLYTALLKTFKDAEKATVISNKEYKRAREFYRGCLPQNATTERLTTMNLRSWANFIKLRLTEHAQPEIRYVASLMFEAVKASGKIPYAFEALENNQWMI